jgi:hypothetical protein
MKKTFSIGLIVLLSLLVIWYSFIYNPLKFDTKPFEVKIDSLQHEVDSLHKDNFKLESFISVFEEDNVYLVEKTGKLQAKIGDLKEDLKDAKDALKYTPTQVDSFFVAKYSGEYANKSEDTTHLPLEVSKAVVVDLKEGEVNEKIVITQDSVIVTMDSSLKNRAEVIAKLREKEVNYVSIIDKKVQQEELYKVQVSGLKQDIKKQEKRLKWNRIQKVVLGAAIIGLIIK